MRDRLRFKNRFEALTDFQVYQHKKAVTNTILNGYKCQATKNGFEFY